MPSPKECPSSPSSSSASSCSLWWLELPFTSPCKASDPHYQSQSLKQGNEQSHPRGGRMKPDLLVSRRAEKLQIISDATNHCILTGSPQHFPANFYRFQQIVVHSPIAQATGGDFPVNRILHRLGLLYHPP